MVQETILTWSNGATTEDLSDLGAGTYSGATDENGNTVSISVEITESEYMAISSPTLTILALVFRVMVQKTVL